MKFFAKHLRGARRISRPQFRPSFECLEGRVVPATHFAISVPASATAGSALSFTVTALDDQNQPEPGYAGTAHFTSSDGAAVLPADMALQNGVGTFNLTLKTAGSETVTATDTVDSTITGTSSPIIVSAAAADHFAFSVPVSASAGTAFGFTVTAKDQFNNTVTGYTGTVHFTSNDGAAVLPADLTLTNGTGNLNATLKTAGSETITATDTTSSSITGTSSAITVQAAAGTHFSVSAPSTGIAGGAFSYTVTALDQFNNTATGYAGTVHFTSTDPQAVLPANIKLTNGVGTFSATLKISGSQTISATDTVSSGITGVSGTITVSAASATHFGLTLPGSVTAGTAFSFTVTALDQFNNTVTGYTGTVHFTSTDTAAVLPADGSLTNGVGTFSATLKTGGGRNIVATDTNTASVTGTGTTTVLAGAATHFVISGTSPSTITTQTSFLVTAQDQFNNTATTYTGTVHFTSTDAAATLPADSLITNGTGNFLVTFKTGGNQTLTVTDKTTSSITGTSNTVVVQTPPAFTNATSATFTVGSSGTFTITTTGAPIPTITATGVLPAGVTFTDNKNGTATITGTPTTFGTFKITITAHNGVGSPVVDATQTFTLTVSNIPSYAVTQLQRFVAHAYADLLVRFVEEPAMNFWVGQLNQGMSRTAFASALDHSIEYVTDQVQDIYQHYLGRAAEPAALVNGVSFLLSGGTDESLAAIVAGSPEYYRGHGGNANGTFITALFGDALHRAVEINAILALKPGLDTGATTPAQLAMIVLSSQEYTSTFVSNAYQTFLRRPADAGGLAFGVNSLRSGMTDEQFLAFLVGSDEYFQTQVGN